MPDAPPPAPLTTAWWTANGRQQVITQLSAASLPAAATEGRVYAVTDRDRLEIDTGTVLLPGPAWGTAGRVGFALSDATNRSIPTGTGTHTALTFGTEVTDTDGFFTAGGTTVTIPTNRGGLYAGMFQCTWASSPGANSAISLLVNGATAWRICPTAATQLLVCALPIGALGLNAGDTLQVTASQGSGGAININPSQWQMWRLSA